MTKAAVYAPVVDPFVQISGDPEHGRWVQNVTFRGLSFRYGQYLLPPEGHADGQAEYGIPAAIMADGARSVSPGKLRNRARRGLRHLVPGRLPG